MGDGLALYDVRVAVERGFGDVREAIAKMGADDGDVIEFALRTCCRPATDAWRRRVTGGYVVERELSLSLVGGDTRVLGIGTELFAHGGFLRAMDPEYGTIQEIALSHVQCCGCGVGTGISHPWE